VPSVSVLYITDEVVGPHLELLRNICEPQSKSRPHVTVRFFDKLSIPQDHLSTQVKHIDVLEPGAFGFDGEPQENRTIFLRCKSDDLLPLEHKPLFPTSEFHITLYDGLDKIFAASVLSLLKEYEWAFRVPLPALTSLTAIQIKPKKRRKGISVTPSTREYRAHVAQLFFDIANKALSWEYVVALDMQARLQMARLICNHLIKSVKKFEHVSLVARVTNAVANEFTDLYEVHLTPPELAHAITETALRYVANERSIDFGDPAAGTGAFFAALTQLVPRERISSAIGIEISSSQVEAARWRWSAKGMDVIQGDYLHLEKLPARNLILANPPYLRHQGIPTGYKRELQQRTSVLHGSKVSGLSGQYLYFMLLSDQWMAPNAIAAWLIPSEFMQTHYGRTLREYLANSVELLRIHQFNQDNPQFENAEVLPCVVFFRKRVAAAGHIAYLTYAGTLDKPAQTDAVEIEKLRVLEKWSIPLRIPRSFSKQSVRLGDLFNVRRGIATGANEFFVLERTEARKLGIPPSALRPILPKFRSLDSDVVERLDDGYPALDLQLCIIDTVLSEEILARRHPRLYDYFQVGIGQGLRNRYLISKRTPWYKQEQRAPAPFLCTYMGRSRNSEAALHFIWNKSDAIATNTYLMLYPTTKTAQFLLDHPSMNEVVFSLLKATASRSVSDNLRVHAGGLLKIEPRELSDVIIEGVPAALRRTLDLKLL
jgi:adenine-specific DNA-methyltransferase